MSLEIEVVPAAQAGMNEEALKRLDAGILADIHAEMCDGAAYLVARGGKVVRNSAVGLTDLNRGRAARTDDLFCMMSVSKSFTAALVLRLCDQGRLSLSTRIGDIVPEFASKGKDHVTIFHALTHTGGIWSGFAPPAPLTLADAVSLDRYVPAICNMALAFEPGTQVTYCPMAGHAMLGEVVRRLDPAGRSFRQIAKEDIFAPLGMKDTTFGLAVDAPRRVPLTQREAGEGGVAERGLLDQFNVVIDENAEMCGGGAYGTTADVFRFAEMLRMGGRLGDERTLSPSLTRYALQNHTGSMRNTTWDYSRRMRGIPEYPANFALMGGYMRGNGYYMNPAGLTASPEAFVSVGGGSTMFLIDPARDLTFIFLCAGLLEGLNHFVRLQKLSDLALAAVED